MGFWEIIKYIGSILSAILVIISFLSIISKSMRTEIIKFIKGTSGTDKIESIINSLENIDKKVESINNQISDLTKASQCTLRKDILDMYYKYDGKGYIPLYAREDILKAYKIYHKIGGNGSIDHVIEQIDEMPDRPIDNNERR